MRRRLGQATHFSHPHILESGQLLPGVLKKEFDVRRTKLFNALPKNSAMVLTSADEKYFSSDCAHKFRQDSDFMYFTGFLETDSIAVFHKNAKGKCSFSMFVTENDPKTELWVGPRTGIAAALDLVGADKTFDISNVAQGLPEIFTTVDEVFLSKSAKNLDQTLWNTVESLFMSSTKDGCKKSIANNLVDTMRVKKSPAEIALMRKASNISAAAHEHVMRRSLSLMCNGAHEGLFLNEFLSKINELGATGWAYEPIFASGQNATTLHYGANNGLVSENDLMLVDAGADFHFYASDITRTFPVNGQFTLAQRKVYDLVLGCQLASIDYIKGLLQKGSAVSLEDAHNFSLSFFENHLEEELGVPADKVKAYYPHGLGHYIGIDTHDTLSIAKTENLSANCVFTVEPGLYFRADDDTVPEELRGIGVRIEDQVLVNSSSDGLDVQVLTSDVVKVARDVENLMRE